MGALPDGITEQQPHGGENGCGLFFCGNHADGLGFCERCAYNQELGEDRWQEFKPPFEAKPDVPRWIRWKLKDKSWAQWREKHPYEVERMKAVLEGNTPNAL